MEAAAHFEKRLASAFQDARYVYEFGLSHGLLFFACTGVLDASAAGVVSSSSPVGEMPIMPRPSTIDQKPLAQHALDEARVAVGIFYGIGLRGGLLITHPKLPSIFIPHFRPSIDLRNRIGFQNPKHPSKIA
jgi:hypothetical protein